LKGRPLRERGAGCCVRRNDGCSARECLIERIGVGSRRIDQDLVAHRDDRCDARTRNGGGRALDAVVDDQRRLARGQHHTAHVRVGKCPGEPVRGDNVRAEVLVLEHE